MSKSVHIRDKRKLAGILVSLNEFSSGKSNTIRLFLAMCDLEEFYSGLQLDGIPASDAFLVIDTLEKHGKIAKTPEYDALGQMIEYVLEISAVALDDKAYMATLIVKHDLVRNEAIVDELCEKYKLSSPKSTEGNNTPQDSTVSQINRRRAERSTAPTIIQKYDRIDHDRILRRFDLVKQVYELQTAITNATAGSVVHVVTTSNPWLLQKYMIPRLLEVLEESTGIVIDFRQVSIDPSDLANEVDDIDIVEHRLKAIYPDLSWQRLFEACAERKMRGCFLSVESHGLQSEQLKQFATSVETEAVSALQSMLEATGQSLVICWVNSVEHPLPSEKCFAVPEVEPFTHDEVSTWFDSQLNLLNVAQEDIQSCKIILSQKLAYTRGEPVLTYQAMQDIITTLSR